MNRRPARWVGFGVLWLCAGVAANFAVTWAMYLSPWGWRGPGEGAGSGRVGPWPCPVPAGWPATCRHTGTARMWIVDEHMYEVEPPVVAPHRPSPAERWASNVAEWEAGWPLRGLRCWDVTCESLVGYDIELRGGLKVRNDGYSNSYLPCTPMWPGFGVNAVLYGALAAGAWRVGVAGLLARRRKCAGTCRCGYDLHGLTPAAVCPECGRRTRQVTSSG